MYSNLFKLCGFEPEQLERERPRIEKAFDFLGIGQEDISRAEERVNRFWNIELKGVRKLLGMRLNELVDLALAKEESKKIVYLCYPPMPMVSMVGIMISDDIYFSAPEGVLTNTLGAIFDKVDPLLEAGEQVLAPGLAHCAMDQLRLGAISKGVLPIPDLAIASGHFCDQSPKTDELIHEIYDMPVVYVDNCMDANWDEWPRISPRRVQYLSGEIKRAMQKFEEVTGTTITEDLLRNVRKTNARIWFTFQQIVELMRNDPVPLSQGDIGLIWWMVGTPTKRSITEGMEAITILHEEVKERVARGIGAVPKGSPRVFWDIQPARDPSLMRMVEGLGLAVPVTSAIWLTPGQKAKSEYSSFEEVHAEALLRGGLDHSVPAYIDQHIEICRNWGVDGAIIFYMRSCRPYTIPPLMVKKDIQKQLGIPVLILEGDIYDCRNYTSEQLRTRVETFAEMLKAKKG